MDVNIIIGQISDPPIWNNAVLAAALSALLVSLANLYLDDKGIKKLSTNDGSKHIAS